MRAAYYNRLGPASEVIEIGEMPPPRAGPGEVLVEVRASGIDPHDVKKRPGWIAHEALEAGGHIGGIVVEIESGASG